MEEVTSEMNLNKGVKRDSTVVILAVIIILGFFIGVFSLIFISLDKGSGAYEILLILFGALSAKFSTVVDYFFGSSDK